MSTRVIVFEDNDEDRARFKELFDGAQWPVEVVRHPRPKEVTEIINQFKPELAIVDSVFTWQRDGLQLIKELRDLCPAIAVVVCTVLRDSEQHHEHRSILQEYHDCGVSKILPKHPFPTLDDFAEY